jgi:hypothetical protein
MKNLQRKLWLIWRFKPKMMSFHEVACSRLCPVALGSANLQPQPGPSPLIGRATITRGSSEEKRQKPRSREEAADGQCYRIARKPYMQRKISSHLRINVFNNHLKQPLLELLI